MSHHVICLDEGVVHSPLTLLKPDDLSFPAAVELSESYRGQWNTGLFERNVTS